MPPPLAQQDTSRIRPSVVLCGLLCLVFFGTLVVTWLSRGTQQAALSATVASLAAALAHASGIVAATSREQRFLARPPHSAKSRRVAGILLTTLGHIAVLATCFAMVIFSTEVQVPEDFPVLLLLSPLPAAPLLIVAGSRLQVLPPSIGVHELEDRFRVGLPKRADALTPFEAMLDFYRLVRVTGCNKNGCDTLQFGVHPLRDARLEVVLSRTLQPRPRDSVDGLSLSVSSALLADDVPLEHVDTLLTCCSVGELPAFSESVMSHPAIRRILFLNVQAQICLHRAYSDELPSAHS